MCRTKTVARKARSVRPNINSELIMNTVWCILFFALPLNLLLGTSLTHYAYTLPCVYRWTLLLLIQTSVWGAALIATCFSFWVAPTVCEGTRWENGMIMLCRWHLGGGKLLKHKLSVLLLGLKSDQRWRNSISVQCSHIQCCWKTCPWHRGIQC